MLTELLKALLWDVASFSCHWNIESLRSCPSGSFTWSDTENPVH